MEEREFIEECIDLFTKNRLSCAETQAKQLYRLTERMLEVNRSMNLTAITEEKAVILRHYVDSLTISEHIPKGAAVIDVGCGAGFPSLPLAIFREDLTITALDGTAERIAYVQETAKLLGLSNLTAISGRAEELGNTPDFLERFDIATARAVASLPVLCELCLPFVKVGGHMIAMKAQQAEDELETAKRGIQLCGGSKAIALPCNLTDGDLVEQRKLILIPKATVTPKNYPRHFSKISKKPL